MRELTYTSTQIAHPEWVDGRRLWLDPEVRDVVSRLRDGDPTRGWEGDPRLALYFIPGSRQWELMRLEADGEYRTVARSKPGAKLTPAIIDELVARDVRRGFDLKKSIDTHNSRVRRSRSAEFQAWIDEEIGPRLGHAISKGRVHRESV